MELRDVRRLTGVEITPYDISGGSPGQHLGLPSATATLIVDLADGLVLGTEGRSETDTFRCCLAGMHLRPVTIHHDGSQVGVQVSLSPAAVRALFGLPVGELANGTSELAQIDTDIARRLHDQLAQAHPDDRAAVCAGALVDIASDAAPFDDAHAAWEYLARRRGDVTVAELVEQSGWSARYLTRLFTAEFGIGPKQAARLMRFDAARAGLEAGRAAVDVAADCGYADQSHMSREFTDLTGLSPRSLLRRRAEEFG
ncbi:helix-turn-helix domain-containing protein [Gordonia phthalatica]|uniref:AraC family transcriptional regulator n=1 Tax=Gordonia phthalatica TaxID=1136941 RepID=A0A0N9N6J7_9ACTN|nr:helix-turn-helix transcriptional regulator [Gordonia phthalatica]ALG83458.1 AraC family transcriptional regulator [Gordonia phthalatica]